MSKLKNTLIIGALLLCLVGCGALDSVGVYNSGEYEYYVISLAEENSVDDYFHMTGEEGEISVVVTQAGQLDAVVRVVKYSNVKEGGCVAYIGKTVAYVPYECGPDKMKTICGLIANHPDDCMTIEMAKKYISFLDN